MKTEEEIIEEIKRRGKFTLEQSDSYSGYRANLNFIRGLLWGLGIECGNKPDMAVKVILLKEIIKV